MTTSRDDAPRTTHGGEPRRVAIVFCAALAVQLLAVLVVVFGDIGFDKPGRFGLDVDHLLLLVVIWFVATGIGFTAAWSNRKGAAFVLQCVVALVIIGTALRELFWSPSEEATPPAEVHELPRGG